MAASNAPAARTLASQLEMGRFLCGIDEGRWTVLKFEFPDLFVRVVGIDPQSDVAVTQDFRLLCDDYPLPGPFVERWDYEKNVRPPPPTAEHASPAFMDALKDWEPTAGKHGGIYRAWQRYASDHGEWNKKRPDEAWNTSRDITFIMERLHDVVAEKAIWLGRKRTS